MNKISKIALAVALAGASVSASAWWGGPFGGWGDDFFGDAGFDMSFSMHGAGHGWGDYYDYYGPYGYPVWGAVPPVYGYPAAMTEEQQKAMAEQQKAFAEQQAKALQQAIEAQRKLAEQIQKGAATPVALDPFTRESTADVFMPAQFQEMFKKSEEEHVKSLEAMTARRDVFWKRVEARRKAMKERMRRFEQTAFPASTAPFAPFEAQKSST